MKMIMELVLGSIGTILGLGAIISIVFLYVKLKRFENVMIDTANTLNSALVQLDQMNKSSKGNDDYKKNIGKILDILLRVLPIVVRAIPKGLKG
jgi:hypothetical protein